MGFAVSCKMAKMLNDQALKQTKLTFSQKKNFNRKKNFLSTICNFERAKILDCYMSCIVADAGKQTITPYQLKSSSVWSHPRYFTLMVKATE